MFQSQLPQHRRRRARCRFAVRIRLAPALSRHAESRGERECTIRPVFRAQRTSCLCRHLKQEAVFHSAINTTESDVVRRGGSRHFESRARKHPCSEQWRRRTCLVVAPAVARSPNPREYVVLPPTLNHLDILFRHREDLPFGVGSWGLAVDRGTVRGSAPSTPQYQRQNHGQRACACGKAMRWHSAAGWQCQHPACRTPSSPHSRHHCRLILLAPWILVLSASAAIRSHLTWPAGTIVDIG